MTCVKKTMNRFQLFEKNAGEIEENWGQNRSFTQK